MKSIRDCQRLKLLHQFQNGTLIVMRLRHLLFLLQIDFQTVPDYVRSKLMAQSMHYCGCDNGRYCIMLS